MLLASQMNMSNEYGLQLPAKKPKWTSKTQITELWLHYAVKTTIETCVPSYILYYLAIY